MVKRSGLVGLVLAAVVGGVFMVLRGESRAQPFGQFLNLPGPGSGYVEVPHDPALNPTDAVTIEVWVYLRSYAGHGGTSPFMLGKGGSDSYWLSFFPTGRLVVFRPGGGNVQTNRSIPLNTWTHIAVTYDGAAFNIYFNGELDTGASLAGPLTTTDDSLRIGNNRTGDGSPDGYIDEVRIWSVARTQAQIQAAMNTPIDEAMPGLVAVWHLDCNAEDAVGGHHGTLVGDAEFVSQGEPCPSPAPAPSPTPAPAPSPTPTPPAELPIEGQLSGCLAVTSVAWGHDNQAKQWQGFFPGQPEFLQDL
ncbi:MAG: LamG domain-containing protein, partial [Dehalococcoidia bacterium]